MNLPDTTCVITQLLSALFAYTNKGSGSGIYAAADEEQRLTAEVSPAQVC